jgi:NitT/TauT family transport system permease protein
MSNQQRLAPTARSTWRGRLAGTGRLINSLPQSLAITVALTAFLLIWQAIVVLGGIPRILLPGPTDVAQQIGIVAGQFIAPDGFLIGQMWVTIQEIIIGFLLAFVVGVGIGLWVGLTAFGRKAVMPLFVMFEATPKIAFIPVFIAWFGFGMTSKIVMAAFLSVFPIIIGTVSGLNATSNEERKLFASLNASPWMTFWKLRVHRALPFLFAGLQVAIVSSVTGAVAAEFIGGGTGFGEQIRVAATRIDIDRVFAMIVFLSVVGLGLYLLITWLQRTVTFWDNERIPRRARAIIPQ